MSGPTPSQTVGPFFHIGLRWDDGPEVVAPGAPGALLVHGRVLDGEGQPVPDALIETWQADADDAGDGGFGRCPTDAEGRWWIRTRKPGRVPDATGVPQAPHLLVSIFMRGLLQRLVTRIYFPDDAAANAADPVLASLPPEAARTLVAVPDEDGLRFDIRLQGAEETAFFRV